MQGRTKSTDQFHVLPAIRLLVLGFAMLTLVGCGGGNGASSINNASSLQVAVLTDMDIASAVYYDQRTPDGFYQEPTQSGVFSTIAQLRNIDLLPLASRSGVTATELASNDFTEALNWSDTAASIQAAAYQLVDNSETELYFQFTRVNPSSPDFVQLHRVFKADVLDRSGASDSYLGQITAATLSAATVKQVVEYLWAFTSDNNYGNAVLTSDTRETDTAFVHVMQQATLYASNNTNCDTIELNEVTYTVSKATGFIVKDKQLTRIITARRDGGYLEICQ